VHVDVLLESICALSPVDEAADALREAGGFYDFEAELQRGLRAAELQQQKLALHEILRLMVRAHLHEILKGRIRIECVKFVHFPMISYHDFWQKGGLNRL
jgi:hypothetical protein